MEDKGIVILGSGMAGYGAANALHDMNIKARLYDKRPRPGGLTSSFTHGDGFIFDEGVHISFTKSERVKTLFAQSAGNKFETGQVYCNNWWRGHWIKHPAQVNLHALPVDIRTKCIMDFVEASRIENPTIRNYHDWLLASYGTTFATEFPAVYTRKYHTTDATNMTTDWLGPRLYRPKLEEVLRGAMEHEPLEVFYVNEFRYPSSGGFEGFIEGFYDKANTFVNHEVVRIDMNARSLLFKDGSSTTFDKLISSIPLPEMIPLISDVPSDVRDAARKLAATQVVVVNIGINREIDSRPQWSYFYDEDIPFARISYRRKLAPRAVPAGCDAVQAEIYFSDKYRPLTGSPQDWIEPTIDSLIKTGIVRDRQEVIHKSAIFIPFGNIIFDLDRTAAIDTVHGFLRDIGIRYCGRFGEWGYTWTDHAFLSGEKAAKAAMRESLDAVLP